MNTLKSQPADIQRIIAQIAKRIWTDVYVYEKREATPIGKVHVGNIIFECERNAYYSCTIPFSFHNLQATMNFWHGRLLHSRPILNNCKQELAVEWENIIGHIDEYADGILLEKKSASHIPDKPYAIHVRQAEYYKVLLERSDYKVTNVYMIYFLKDMSPQLPTVLPVDTRGTALVAEEMLRKKNIVLTALKNGFLPSPKFGADCNYCQYPSLCFGDKICEK